MALPMVARDELIDQTASFSSNTSSFSSIGGTLRRSLRQINPFKTRLFRLPATPRLARAKKGLSRGEESTNWNFERPLSTYGGSVSVGRQNGAQMYSSIMSTSRPADSFSATPDSLSLTVHADSPAHLRHLKPPGEVGGSCRVRTRHTRPPLPCYNPPPNAREAEEMISEHIQNLMVSSPRPLKRQFLFLPETSYAVNGEVYEANWKRDGHYSNGPAPSSPTHSTVSLLNTGRPTARSMSYGARDEPVHRPHYHLNGLVHQPSLRSLIPSNEIHSLAHFNNTENSTNQLLLTFSDYAPDNSEVVFLGREWIFKEIHQSVISEQNAITLVRGGTGAGKSAIMKQLALHSSFYSSKSNVDTVDSGIVIGSQTSAESTLSSRNYEWLRMIGKVVGAYHECHLYASNTCSIPEFVRNLASHLMAAPSLRAYSSIVHSSKELLNLIRNETDALLCSPIDLFRRLIVEPLCKIDENKTPDCLLIVIDAIDEAEFHRNENGESIAWLVKTCHGELPKWVRWILSASNENSLPFASSEVRSIRIDNDVELDERVARDMRLLIDYRIAINPDVGRCLRERSNPPSAMALADFVDEIIRKAKGNALFVSILMDMIEQERIQVKNSALSLLPSELSQLYLLYFNCVFNSLQQFQSASTILSIVLASLRPLTFENLYQIINSAQTEPQVSIKELEKRLLILQPFISKLNSGSYVLMHNSLREWLLNGSNHTDYLVNARYGHLLHALNFVNQSELTTENLYELGHHLLKANPHKYMPKGMASDMPSGRDAQVQWLQKAAGHRLQLALLFERNVYYPNSKVSRLLLMAGASADSILPDNDPLLCKYASAGNNTLIQLLIQYGANINASNQQTGLTPLMYAVKNNHLQTVQFLLQCGVDISARDREGNSALVHVAGVNSTEMFAMLFEAEWPNEDQSEEIERVFQAAVQAGNIELCKFILDKSDTPMDLSTSLLIACCSNSDKTIEIVQLLLSHGATLKPEQKWQGKSALLCAIQSGLYDLTKGLLDNRNLKINTEVSENQGWSPLIVAAHYGRIGLIQELIDRGCFIDASDLDGVTAIGHAIKQEHFSIATLLIKNGCNVHVVDNEGNTLLHFLALHHNKALFERLLELGLQVDAKNSLGLRPVELAIMSGNKQNSVDVFLRRGARLRHVTWLIAAKHNPEYILTLIEKLFNDGRTLHRRGRTPDSLHRFQHALQKCNEFLQEEGCPRFLNQMQSSLKSIDSLNNNNYNTTNLASIRPQLRYLNCQILFALASIQLQNGSYNEALDLTTEGLRFADSEAALFQLHSFRANAFFDHRDMKNALIAAQLAGSLRPENKEIQAMLSTLTSPSPLEF